MELRIDRFKYTDSASIGRMSINGAHFCYTLEDKIRPGEVKVYGNTAIPEGRYEIVMYKGPHFGIILPLLKDVPGFTGILIHVGNYAKDTDGCILVGQAPREDYIGNSKKTLDDLLKKIKPRAIKEKIWITIKNIGLGTSTRSV